MQILIILALVLAIVGGVFIVQNPVTVTIHFLAWQFQGALPIILLSAFVLGFLISYLLSAAGIIRRKLRHSSQEKRIRQLENQLKSKGEIPAEPITRETDLDS